MTIEELRVFLNISEDDDTLDDTIESLYALSKTIFTQNTRVNLEQATHTEQLVNFSGNALYLNNTPVVSVTSINTYSEFNGTATEVTAYQLIDNVVYLSSSVDVVVLEIEYVAGYSSITASIDQILVQICSFLWTYNDRKVFLSSNGEAILEPDQVKLPKHTRDSMAIYRVGL